MFSHRTLNDRLNNIDERALLIADKEYRHDCGLLLEPDKSLPVHVQNLQLLMTKIYKTNSNLIRPKSI